MIIEGIHRDKYQTIREIPYVRAEEDLPEGSVAAGYVSTDHPDAGWDLYTLPPNHDHLIKVPSPLGVVRIYLNRGEN